MSITERIEDFLGVAKQRRIEIERNSNEPPVRIRRHLRDGGRVEFQFGELGPVVIEGTDAHSEEWGKVKEDLSENPEETLIIRLVDRDGEEQKSFREEYHVYDSVRDIWQTLVWNWHFAWQPFLHLVSSS